MERLKLIADQQSSMQLFVQIKKQYIGAGSWCGRACSGLLQITRTKGSFMDRLKSKPLQNSADQYHEAWFPTSTRLFGHSGVNVGKYFPVFSGIL